MQSQLWFVFEVDGSEVEAHPEEVFSHLLLLLLFVLLRSVLRLFVLLLCGFEAEGQLLEGTSACQDPGLCLESGVGPGRGSDRDGWSGRPGREGQGQGREEGDLGAGGDGQGAGGGGQGAGSGFGGGCLLPRLLRLLRVLEQWMSTRC